MLRPFSKQYRPERKQRREISNVPIERKKTVRTDIPVEIQRREGIRKIRTVRNVSIKVPPIPTVDKAYVCIDTDDSTNLAVNKQWKPHKEATLDKILRRLQKGNHWLHDVLLIITPSKRHRNQYKLHVVDRVTRQHLGMTSLKRKELLQLERTNAFQQYSILICNKYINLRRMAIETAIIPNVVNAINLDCCHSKDLVRGNCKDKESKTSRERQRQQICKTSNRKIAPPVLSSSPSRFRTQGGFNSSISNTPTQSNSSVSQAPFYHYIHITRRSATPKLPSLETSTTPGTSACPPVVSFHELPSKSFLRQQEQLLFDSWDSFRVMDVRQQKSFMELVRRINDPLTRSRGRHVELLFDMISHHNVSVYIRPQFCPRQDTGDDEIERSRMPRFNIECFILDSTYIGGITLDSQQLEQQLLDHRDILSQVQVITDVCEITPLPRVVYLVMRTLCQLLCLELVYDAFGEFIFSLYNRID